MKKKVMLITETLSGGVRRHLMDVLLNIDTTNLSVVLVYSKERADSIFLSSLPKLQKLGIKLYPVENFRRKVSINDILSYYRLKSIIKKEKPDIVHCHSSKAGALGRLAAYHQGIKNIFYTPHAYVVQSTEISKIKHLLFMNIERLLGKITDVTINVSNGERQFALENNIIKENKSVVIYNGIECSVDKVINNNDKIIVGTIARLDSQKDPRTFIEIAINICEKYDNVKFVYIGDGPLSGELMNEIVKKKMSDKIFLYGFKSNVQEYLNTFDIYLSTSLYEGLPYSLIEALENSLPIVATNVIGNNELVMNELNGFLFKKGNSLDGIKKIEMLINNEEIKSIFGKQSRNMYEEKFTLGKMIDSMMKLYL